jgi:hypothetical protein
MKQSPRPRPAGTSQPGPGVSRRHFLGQAAVLAAAGAGEFLTPGTVPADPPGATVEVDVDFGTPVPDVPSMSGFLHNLNTTQPPDALIEPLQPNLWRVGAYRNWRTIYDRLTGFGARLELVLSDTWGYGTPHPYDNFANWKAHVQGQAQLAQGLNVLWDVWNEPNSTIFWQGTPRQLFETYRHAYRELRKVLGPDAWIGGPSLTRYDRSYIGAFLDYCLAHRCEVNFLSWHELQSTGNRIYPIAANLADAYSSFVNNQDYNALNILEIHVNEVIGTSDQYRPGEIWGTFFYLEQGRVGGACKACWPGLDGYSNCANFTLDGLLTHDTGNPRAAWWAYKLYADGVPTRALSGSSDPRAVSLASAGSEAADQAQVLLGYFESAGAPPNQILEVVLENLGALPFLASADALLASLFRIPNSGEQELAAPQLLAQTTLPIAKDGSAVWTLPPLNLHEGFQLTIQNPGPAPALP